MKCIYKFCNSNLDADKGINVFLAYEHFPYLFNILMAMACLSSDFWFLSAPLVSLCILCPPFAYILRPMPTFIGLQLQCFQKGGLWQLSSFPCHISYFIKFLLNFRWGWLLWSSFIALDTVVSLMSLQAALYCWFCQHSKILKLQFQQLLSIETSSQKNCDANYARNYKNEMSIVKNSNLIDIL